MSTADWTNTSTGGNNSVHSTSTISSAGINGTASNNAYAANNGVSNQAGISSIVGGVEEVTGMVYPAIATLDRQYSAPVGQRLLLFVQTNANCGLQGGVETILKLQKTKGRSLSPPPNHATSTCDYNYNTQEDDLDVAYSSRTPSQTNPSSDDPYGFLRDDDTGTLATGITGSSTNASDNFSYASATSSINSSTQQNLNTNNNNTSNSNSSKKGPNLGRFLKKVAKQTTGALERGMHELAIKADQGRTPDLLTACLFSTATGELIAMTDSVPMPRIAIVGVTFSIPLWVPPRFEDNAMVTVKLFIHSQASLMISATGKPKTKHFLLGQTQVNVGQMRKLLLQQRKGFFSLPLASTLVAEGQQLHFCVLPDLKIPAMAQRGWSLMDPQFSGCTSGLYNYPLDQSYALKTPPSNSSNNIQEQPWLIATERAIESTIVLPLAAAFAQICTQACHVSLQHAQAIATHLLAKRTEHDEPGPCANVHVEFQYLQIDASASNPVAAMAAQLPSVNMTLAWQPPDSLFELELIPSATVPVGGTHPQVAPPQLQFFPPVVTTGILPAILKAHGAQLPAFMLGNLRVQLTANTRPPDVWEAVVVLEQHVNQQRGRTIQLPFYSLATGLKVGAMVMTIDISVETPSAPLPNYVSPQRGLVTMVGLENLIQDVVTPMVDHVVLPQQQAAQADDVTRRRQQQLATMGSFMSHAYLDQHVRSRRQADWELFSMKAREYRQVLESHSRTPNTTPRHTEPSWEDRSPKPFRPSSSRPELLLSMIPFNTHNASFSLDIIDPNNSQPNDGALFHNITCGAPADHAAGFGNVFVDRTFTSPIGSVSGGLRRLEAKRFELAQIVKNAQTQLIAGVAGFFQAARQQPQNKFVNHVPARHSNLQNLRWKVFEAVHAYHHVTWICAVRRANAFSQALGIAVTSYLTSLSDVALCQMGWPQLWARHGYLVSYEGLLSAAGKELGMIEDASVAISMLHMVKIVLVPDDNTTRGDPARVPIPHSPLLKWVHLIPTTSNSSTNSRSTQYLLQVGVHSRYFEQRVPACLKNGTQVRFYPVLFQVGVDIRQWGAHAGSNMKNQFAGGDYSSGAGAGGAGLLDDEDDDVGVSDDDVLVALNYEALQKMNAYAHLISPVPGSNVPAGDPFDTFLASTSQSSQQQAKNMSVHPSLSMLHNHVMTSAGRMNHSILDEAATMAQQLGGGGVVFCKSGKDRTAMHVTYKQAQFANRFRQQRHRNQEVPDTTLEDATRMRIYGTRLPVCEKNVGQALYAFNSLQSKFMPDALKPPPSTLAGFLKGGRLLTGGGIET
ncbi:II inositol 3,4-bisphosphate 4-phosphatase [Seminavis robusta]|uniref:II inositol 3,4-bisphosphate 4-phosphatase n=1 Tax=Seminavis robusta TaxID=568900 RepID=A0A9N8H5M1_9STRA|nr:II inositol 3,4-bisphosphate 4-phosphatase [Seminavis robusta]|eukprot:Sro77_g042210.1 II inositol 3,4-bisphosphate 4-phosphatase (1300) ;mRNA; f:96821-100720